MKLINADWPDPNPLSLPPLYILLSDGRMSPPLPPPELHLHSPHRTLTPPRPRIPPKRNITIFYSPQSINIFSSLCTSFSSHQNKHPWVK